VEHVDRSPVDFQKITLPKLEKHKATIVEKPHFAELLEAADTTRLFPFLVLADASGCRRGEMLALQWPDIDADYCDNNLVFCKPDGSYYKPDKVSVRVTELVRKCGLKSAELHALRHTHASGLLSKGVPIPAVAKRLGHKNASVTRSIYSHAIEADE
jgi:integrase